MNTKLWKVASIVLVLLITGVSFFIQGFHYYSIEGTSFPNGSNESGTLVIIEAWPSVNVRFNASFSFTGNANGPAEIILENGTRYVLNNSHPNVYVTGMILGKLFSPSGSGTYYYNANISSYENPVEISMVNNFSYSNFNSQYLHSKILGPGYYAIFVFNYSLYYIRAVAMPE